MTAALRREKVNCAATSASKPPTPNSHTRANELKYIGAGSSGVAITE